VILTLVAILIAALLVAAAVARFVPPVAVTAGVAAICVLVAVLAAVALSQGAGAATLTLPVGPAGAMHLTLDPLAASFLLLLFLVVPCGDTAPLPLAALAITLLAGDGFTLSAGVLLLGGGVSLRLAILAAVCLMVALALASSPGDFAAIRMAPPEGWRAAAVLALVLASAGALSRISPTLAVYLVLRVLFDLCGAGQLLWWAAPLLLAGAAVAAIGSLRAALADTLHAAAAVGALHLFGMATMALGVALFARSADLPSVEAHALEAAWLALVCHALCRTLLLLCADAVERGAGTRRLGRLGGLVRRMPVTAACCLVALFATVALPSGLGFAAFWLLFQSLLALARSGELGLQLLAACVMLLTGLSVGLAALAAVRLFGTVFLGRPRMPRTAAAEDAPRPVRLVLVGLAASIAVLGLLPALALLPAAGWTGSPAFAAVLVLRAGAEAAGYSPIAVAGLLAVAGIGVMRALRRSGAQGREPAWTGGFAAPPAWLPFGDPATQYSAASFVEPLQRVVALLPPMATIRNRLVRWREAVLRAATALVAS
jgi:hydrogenase-4 component B